MRSELLTLLKAQSEPDSAIVSALTWLKDRGWTGAPERAVMTREKALAVYSLRKISFGAIDAAAGAALGEILVRIEQLSPDAVAIQSIPNQQSTEFVMIFTDQEGEVLLGGVIVKANTKT